MNDAWGKAYRVIRIILFLLFVATAFFVVYRILFPIENFSFFFRIFKIPANNIVEPRNSNDDPLLEGKLAEEETLLFDAPVIGDFSDIKIKFDLERASENLEEGMVRVRKSYRAFLFPEGDPLGFPESSLVRNGNNYFIVTGGNLRKFASLELAKKMGFNENAFLEVQREELLLNRTSEPISDSSVYPTGTLFKIDGQYYQLDGNKLRSFVSNNVFTLRHRSEQAIEKKADFLKSYEISEEKIGFPDGTLISYGQSVFIINKTEALPIDSDITFIQSGYEWGTVIPATSEEFSIYKRGKLQSIRLPHPDGTIFYHVLEKKYYYISDGAKHELPGSGIVASYLGGAAPIIVAGDPENQIESCELEKSFGIFRTYSCDINIDSLDNLSSNNYQFSLEAEPDIQIRNLKLVFRRLPNRNNLNISLNEIVGRFNYQYLKK